MATDRWMKEDHISCPWPMSEEAFFAHLAGLRSDLRRLSREIKTAEREERQWERHMAAERAAETLRQRPPPSRISTLQTFAYRWRSVTDDPDEIAFLADLFLGPVERQSSRDAIRIA